MKCIIYPDAAGEYRWKFVARNGRIIACSGEGFTTRYGATRAATNVKVSAPRAKIEYEK